MVKINGLSLFANAGIGEYYLKDSVINMTVANELLPERANFHKVIYPNCDVITGDITNQCIFDKVMNMSVNNNVKYIQATPPCQSFSLCNTNKVCDDPRSVLITKVIDAIEAISPEYTLIENVEGMKDGIIPTNDGNINVITYLRREVRRLGYSMNIKKLNAANYNTPQSRERLILLISRKRLWEFPKKSSNIVTVFDAIGHLPSMSSGEHSGIPWHFTRKMNDDNITWLQHTPTGQSAYDNDSFSHQPSTIDKHSGKKRLIKAFHSAYSRKSWYKPSPTILMNSESVGGNTNVPLLWGEVYRFSLIL